MNKKTTDVWVAWAIRNKRSVFFYQNKVIDLTEFANIHPGGRKSLENYIYKDITHTLFRIYPHNREQTLQRMVKYTIGSVQAELVMVNDQNLSLNRDKSPKQQKKKKVCFQKKGARKSMENVESKKSLCKQKQNVRAKEKSLTKKPSQLSTSRDKPSRRDRFEVSIRLIEGVQQDKADEKKKVAKKKQKTKQKWFQLQVDRDEMQQKKSSIVLRVLKVKGKLSL